MRNEFVALQPVLAFAATHRDRDPQLATLSALAQSSPSHFHRRFTALARESPKQFSLRLRLESAAALLLTTRRSILDIALSCGFQSHEVFIRAFRRHFRLAPRLYRRRGFTNNPSRAQAQRHAVEVTQAGPCLHLYHLQLTPQPKDHPMSYTIESKQLEPQPIVSAERRIQRAEIPATIGKTLHQVFLFAQANGLAVSGPPFTRHPAPGLGLITIEPGVQITAAPTEPIPADANGVQVGTFPGGPAAYTIHMGPYEKLQEAYAALDLWMTTNGHTPAAAPWEFYMNDPTNHPDPAEWRTDIYWPYL